VIRVEKFLTDQDLDIDKKVKFNTGKEKGQCFID
jgi:hypothetical protein